MSMHAIKEDDYLLWAYRFQYFLSILLKTMSFDVSFEIPEQSRHSILPALHSYKVQNVTKINS